MRRLSNSRISAMVTLLFLTGELRSMLAATTNLVPVADTYIRDSAPTSNFGATTPLLVGLSATPLSPPLQHGLFRFSLDGIPSGAVITNATLQLIAVAGPREPYNFDLSRLLVSWTEDGATWNVRQSGTAWASAGSESGSDYAAASSATAVLASVNVPVAQGGQPVTNAFSSVGMVADVQSWLNDPSSNFGWILHVANGQAGSGRQLASREDLALKPVLTVGYSASEPSAPPVPPTIFGTVIEAGAIRFSFNAQSNHTYTVQFRDSFTTNDWFPLTNLPALPDDTTIHVTNSVVGAERYFRVRTQ